MGATLYRRVVRPALFRLDAERAHELALDGLSVVSRLTPLRPPSRPRPEAARVMGITFPSRVGLAAGLDKDGRALRAWPLLGFGFVEVGTVTAVAQPGNPRPRLFRLPQDEAVVNRMGFNNAGAAALAARLERLGPLPVPLGISLGKSKVTPVEAAVEDYLTSLRLLHRHADYVAVNVSSPNTPGLRSLQDGAALRSLVHALVAEARLLAGPGGLPVPIVVKLAPDLSEQALEELVDVSLGHGVAGLIATNTTLDRSCLRTAHPAAGEAGGLSGRPLAARAVEVVRRVNDLTGGRLPVIGVGGVLGPDDALRLVDAGASLVQVYTGLVYQGPAMVRRVARALDAQAHTHEARS